MAIPKPRWRNKGCGILLALAALSVLGLLAVLWRVGDEPEPWRLEQRRQQEQSPEQREALARSAESRLWPGRLVPDPLVPGQASTLAEPSGQPLQPLPTIPPSGRLFSKRGEDPRASSGREASSGAGDEASTTDPRRRKEWRQVTLTLDEINALLQEYSARWQAQAGDKPLPLSNPILVFEEDHLVLLAQLSTPAMDVLLGLPFDVFVDPSGGTARLLGVRLGRMSLPGIEALPRLLRSAGDERLDRLADQAEQAGTGYGFDPRLGLSAGGEVRIVDLELSPEERLLYLTVEDL
jgi:hypothetical protein